MKVIDIGQASSLLSDVLSQYNFKNLDEVIPSENTTTEFMCMRIHSDLVKKLQSQTDDKSKRFRGALRVKLFESHKAWASYTNTVE